ncbi:hypothetical protein CONPUDRAFT_167200 [Coniophora puteana RWD-64-598 SS2]|uniref:F-box domain-containing protein n=1 Tax=Coniophora puteana (strain RWD-64-598) TaxID=741705 RepID=A0A5M3MHL1_CONPW|nr:uncharacterized protein CONPUDRAFT_167200 [Coniophora puteana RWD-64-598 SS2]EIW78125.1 hypothetical protein CONPUDRAFT_167200 [Coniophora puteana RWD-64-598 SS2]
MHKCLSINEIFCVVCEHLSSSGPSAESGALVALAATCRDFKEPALDVLWAELDHLGPLIMALPEDWWEMEWDLDDEGDEERLLIIRRPLGRKQWDRIRYYSARVQSLEHNDRVQHKFFERISSSAFTSLSFPPHPSSLFPNLVRLQWKDTREEVYSFLRVMLGPSLRELHMDLPLIDNPSSSKVARSFLHSIGTLCPSLRILCINGPHDHPDYEDAVSDLVLSLGQLTELRCGFLNLVAFSHLNSLQSLSILSVIASRGQDYSALPEFSVFSDMLELSLRTFGSLEDLMPLLQRFPRHPPFSMFCARRCTVAEARRFLAYLVNVSNSERSGITIDVQGGDMDWHGQHLFLSFRDIQPLSKFKNLEILVVAAGVPISLDDGDVMAIASYWPRLRVLNLCGLTGCGGLSRVTLKGLLALLKYCQYLHFLWIAFDPRPREGLSRGRPGGGVINGLAMLDVGDSPIDDPTAVAMVLSDVCPRIERLGGWSETTWGYDAAHVEEQRAKWKEVESLLAAYTAIRKQERLWARMEVKGKLANNV